MAAPPVLPFIAGIMLGLSIGVLVVAGATLELALSFPLAAIVAIFAGAIIGSFLLGASIGGKKPREIQLTGRVFEFPQGPIMVEVALKRMGSLIPAKPTKSD